MRLYLYALCFLFACTTEPAVDTVATVDPYTLPSTDGEALNMVVEIPAGTNHKIEYHPGSGYVNDTLADGSTRIVNFLPYPGNYGFVPSTLMDKSRGGDGDALDVLVIGESVPTGTQLRVIPIGALMLRDRGEIDTKIIAVAADPEQRTLDVTNFLDFTLGNDAAKRIIETWFLNYKGPNVTELLRWEDEAYAWREVRKWQTDNQ
ncbi:inorganic pyrophosphatase [Neolewinella xylanilytica]|uniref:inorganic diphosphatase n=1 Tax=Neolewinella xylanilytica TaxID=1514080 RepID=A0A2S6I3G7_9BACT|nr:inorganic diphosphatase [Neolewinella xylanilytica]PPK85724.1 inorganic pyrophosphatase [Neolewinella xylanilytica]